MFEILIPLIISIIALFISFMSFYFNHIDPADLIIEHLSMQKTREVQDEIRREHIISIVNHGGKMAIIKKISAIPNDKNIIIKRIRLTVANEEKTWDLNDQNPYAIITINKKTSLVLFYTIALYFNKDYSAKDPKYKIQIHLDDSVKYNNIKIKSPDIIKCIRE